MTSIVSPSLRAKFQRYLPDTIRINGDQPWDPQILDDTFYKDVDRKGTLGLGEAYMDGKWDCKQFDQVDVFFEHALRGNVLERFWNHPTMIKQRMQQFFCNPQNRRLSRNVIDKHYDPGSNVILSFLDPYNQYTCGYWKDCTDLNTAQEKKLDLMCRKLKLKTGDRVLDIGGGWGGFAKFAALHYGCHVTMITISDEQIQYAREFCKGLPVNIMYCDYRDLDSTYDKILICGMGEHVGYKNYKKLMYHVDRSLDQNGIFLWHTIGKRFEDIVIEEPWILKYIFPNSILPTIPRIARASQPFFDLVDMQEFGQYYEPTLMAWRDNLVKNWSNPNKGPADPGMNREFRMWYYYLSSCAAMFRVRRINLWQCIFQKAGAPAYESVRYEFLTPR